MLTQEQTNRAIARRYYDEILNQGRLDVIDELMAADFMFMIPTHPDPYFGPDGFKNLVTMLRGAFPDVHISVEHMLAEGDTVVAHWTGSGTHTGGPLHSVMGDIPATGKHFVIDGMSWLRMADGRIVESLANEDTVGLLMQLGIIPIEKQPVVTTPEENKAMVMRYFGQLMSEGDLALIEEIVHPDFAFRIPTLPEPVRGRDGMRNFVNGLHTGFPDITFSVERIIADGDKVAARWTITGTHRGTFLGVPASNNPVKDHGIDIFRFSDGKIIEIFVNENDLGLMQQMGAIPSGEPAAK